LAAVGAAGAGACAKALAAPHAASITPPQAAHHRRDDVISLTSLSCSDVEAGVGLLRRASAGQVS
jgi:hypothetical protein